MNRLLKVLRSNTLTFGLAFLLLAWVAYQRLPDWFKHQQLAGKPLPQFSIAMLDQSDRNAPPAPIPPGQKTLLVFWATWCGFCRADIPDLNQLHGEMRDQGLRIIAITDEHPLAVANFRQERKIEYPLAIDPGGGAHQALSISAYPTFVFVDADGVVESINTGAAFFLLQRVRFWVTGWPLSRAGAPAR